jgi:hypothetical protein
LTGVFSGEDSSGFSAINQLSFSKSDNLDSHSAFENCITRKWTTI